MPDSTPRETTRRELLGDGRVMAALALVLAGGSASVLARDYTSSREALDDLDRLASLAEARLKALRQVRADAGLLTERFLARLRSQRATRDDVRVRLSVPPHPETGFDHGSADPDLPGLLQALDDLMLAYAESLPVFGDSSVVSRLAIDMVEVSKLRTVIDLWVVAEEA